MSLLIQDLRILKSKSTAVTGPSAMLRNEGYRFKTKRNGKEKEGASNS